MKGSRSATGGYSFPPVVCLAGKRKKSASGSTRAGVEATAELARLHTTVTHCRLIHLRRRGCYSLLSGGSRSRSGGGRLLRRTGAQNHTENRQCESENQLFHNLESYHDQSNFTTFDGRYGPPQPFPKVAPGIERGNTARFPQC